MESIAVAPPRTGKDLIAATRPFADESRALSVWYTASTLALLGATLAGAAFASAMWQRAMCSVLAGFLVVRGFILFHDVMHGALLRGSRVGRAVMSAFGVLVLTPPTVWRQTHNYHHAHTAKIVGSHVGSFPMLTVDLWRRATPMQRLAYRAVRHPLTILCAYLTVFLYGMCIAPLVRAPRKHWDAAVALVLHAALVVLLEYFAGFAMVAFALLLPLAVACAVGAYLFYAQHNFPDVTVQPRETWEYTRAALESSSWMRTGPVMAWFTGNIGLHHVHHLNPSIPFYRLPDAMHGVPELQHPHSTSLHPRDIVACLRLALWDPAAGRMVPYPPRS